MYINPPRKPKRLRKPPNHEPWHTLEGGYSIYELDRTFTGIHGDFWLSRGIVLNDIIKESAERDGHLAILDVGCGTGNALSYIRQYLERREIEVPVRMVGVSKENFSRESQSWRTRSDAQDGTIGYAVMDVTKEQLPKEVFNIVYSYEMMLHIEEADVAVANMCDSLADGGVMFFNALPAQSELIDSVLAGRPDLEVDKRPAMPTYVYKTFPPGDGRLDYVVAKNRPVPVSPFAS